MSDLRFAVITTVILILAYITALSVTSLARVLAFVGSTGSTSISFILPGLFYYKISDPDSSYHQRLVKEDDDIDEDSDSDAEETAALAQSTHSIHSATSMASVVSNMSAHSTSNHWRWRRKFRWDLEHIQHAHLRRLSLALAIYGFVVMTVCLILNIVFTITH
jgi:amino acid permease